MKQTMTLTRYEFYVISKGDLLRTKEYSKQLMNLIPTQRLSAFSFYYFTEERRRILQHQFLLAGNFYFYFYFLIFFFGICIFDTL